MKKPVSDMISDINKINDVDEILGMYDAYKDAKNLPGLSKSGKINSIFLRRYHLFGKILEQKIFESDEMKFKHNESRNMEIIKMRSSSVPNSALRNIMKFATSAGTRKNHRK
jgi:hypothetical protein